MNGAWEDGGWVLERLREDCTNLERALSNHSKGAAKDCKSYIRGHFVRLHIFYDIACCLNYHER